MCRPIVALTRISDKPRPSPELVAHRGFASRYPENTLVALQAALESGARWLEFDVQLSADAVPVLCHDASTGRTSTIDIPVLDTPWSELGRVEVNEPGRLHDAFHGVLLPSLQQAVELLSGWPGRQAFVELKTESIERHGTATVIERVLETLEPVQRQCVLISFDQGALVSARRRSGIRIGWVLSAWNAGVRDEATELSPAFLICNHTRVPAGEALWPGPWQWVLYEADTPERLRAIQALEPDLVETHAIGELLDTLSSARGEPDG